ncbi:zinc finger SWIM domain-containing protein 3 [Mytilus galloprovincialis]|uniref:Zinc finger SWIM domain-containing protein 3 n=1 Tax=Mytilus galloprovincialis TaxID=29158 RepID=A0A8B6GU64_MYTGA|nr:zinc finger SWIM domain-containing protein 3 [Mytilus galloprovincialis]
MASVGLDTKDSYNIKNGLKERNGDVDVNVDEDTEDRGQWGSKWEFILSCIGLSVGLGNVWRFPYLAYENAGAAFLIAYLVLQFLIGKPMYFMELVMGQFSGLGPTGVWKMNPSAKGIGISMALISLVVAIYYNVIMAYTLIYFFSSMQKTLPWTVCEDGLFEMLPRERRLPEEELKEAEKLVSLQVNNKLMRDHLQDKTGKKVILKDISNIISKVNASKKSDNIESLVSKLKKTGSVVEVFHDFNNQVQGVFYQDEEMQKIFSAYCDIVFVDATYKLNDLRMPLYVIMIEDSLGQSEVAAICLLNSEEKPVLQHLIKCFQKHNPDSSGIKVIMADKDIVERDVFKEEFPDASLLICKFHVLRTFNREITTEKMGISSAQRYVALELIQKLVHSSSEEDYNANLKLIETTCPRQIFNYIDTNWHNIRNEWVLGLTYFEGSLMNTTNNRIESFNQKLKQVIKLYSGLDLFFENFISLIGTLRNERDYKGSVEIQKVPVHIKAMNTTSAEYKYSQLLTGYASYFVIDELKKARKMETIFKTTNSTSHSDDDMELNTNSCTCNFRKSMGLPCKHIFFARLLISIDLFGTELCVSRWTRSYYRENTRLFSPMVSPSKTFCNSSNKVSNASQVVDPRNTTLLSENQKYKKAFFVAQKLAAACSAVGMKEFMSRMKLLTEIEELWKNNHTVEVEDSCTGK